nr:hypothetical protein [Sinorhizobium medicae]
MTGLIGQFVELCDEIREQRDMGPVAKQACETKLAGSLPGDAGDGNHDVPGAKPGAALFGIEAVASYHPGKVNAALICVSP